MIFYNNGWNVNKFQQKFLFATSNITGLSSIYAYNAKVPYYIAFPIYAVWFASNLYWINPIDNWRRKLDIYTNYISLTILVIFGIIYKPPYWYLSLLIIGGSGLLFRLLSIYYSNLLKELHNNTLANDNEGIYYCPIKNNYSWNSALAHSGIHFFANIGVILTIYSYTVI